MSSVPAARQTLQILKYLAGQGSPVRASTISRDLSLPRSTTYHLMRVFQDEGFVVHSPENQAFGLSSLLTEIGSALLSANTLARLAKPILAQLVAETKLPIVAHLGVLEHTDVLYASKVSATRAPPWLPALGCVFPPTSPRRGGRCSRYCQPSSFERSTLRRGRSPLGQGQNPPPQPSWMSFWPKPGPVAGRWGTVK